ncbi:helix-hairpin-helix domain-containing protein [Tamlana sp. 2201CG12-4]|uniref:ComEA family DNA-binding protein n=1 Tax=Tamlana sp. 2201CG12-4 TaxID=3112582 RepID=UPI002DBC764C|nr:helix-hairpin-helix domain-containing protein [Tamlana sp. 2201CG12-4]MEC3907269.1 helix-hairpin-helix domain-containing protein [Tamlana sp. 2201CG12-4]
MSFKSQFLFSKAQRNGIFLLLILIVIFQCIYFFIDFSSKDVQVNKEDLSRFVREVDSLKEIELEKRKTKTFPFNPNYITDYKGAVLGMSNEEIDRLLEFRKQKKWINSAKQFQEVTRISDSLLKVISPYFKFPERLANTYSKTNFDTFINNKSKPFSQKLDLNTVTARQLQRINGVGKVLSDRIIKFRNKSGGFIADVQLQDVYGLTPKVIDNITSYFTVKTPKIIKKINLNSATVDYLVTIPHIDYDLAYEIIEQRKLREGYKSVEELKKVKDFPINKIKIIELYLHLEKEN